MEILSAQFFASLLSIVVIDLVLAGDNAIVIALAARNLPQQLRKRAVVWGTFGAIAVRAAMTAVVVWLLQIPGLMFVGGLMLLWIAYRLLVPSDAGESGAHGAKAAASFWGAMGTIVVADAMMGLDNVLAVAGAAHGSYLLVVLGLIISVPIVVWGSQLVLKLIDRFPAIVYLGAGVLALTAAKMITDEPAIRSSLEGDAVLVFAVYAVLITGVLALALLRNRFRHQDRLERAHAEPAQSAMNVDTEEGGTQPLRQAAGRSGHTLLVVDGSRRSAAAVRSLVQRLPAGTDAHIHLLTVRPALPEWIGRRLFRGDGTALSRLQAEKALQPIAALLRANGIGFETHVGVGARAQAITQCAESLGCDRIVLPSAPRNSLTRLIDDARFQRLAAHTRIPLERVATPHRSPFEGVGYAASLGMTLWLVALLLD